MIGVWLGVDLRMDTKKLCVRKTLDYVLQICSPFKGSIISIIGDGLLGPFIVPALLPLRNLNSNMGALKSPHIVD